MEFIGYALLIIAMLVCIGMLFLPLRDARIPTMKNPPLPPERKPKDIIRKPVNVYQKNSK